MSQHDYVIANASGSVFRGDINDALGAIATLNSGASAPATTYAYMLWADTTNGLLKQRDATNTSWITLFPLTEPVNTTGMVKLWAGTGTPSGYLQCNGAAVSRSTYARLFAVIGTVYGAGDGTTTFNLPTISATGSVNFFIKT